MRWAIHMDRIALAALYKIDRKAVPIVNSTLMRLANDPVPDTTQISDFDPSVYWIAIEGDHLIFYEVIDELHAIRIVKIA